MHRLTSAMCGLMVAFGLLPAYAQSAAEVPSAAEAQSKLQGTWTATKAQRDGQAADDVIGHRLTFTGNRFQIRAKSDNKLLYEGRCAWIPARSPPPWTSSIRKGP
jgi:uncharacterized protein (TIGR03067 family)